MTCLASLPNIKLRRRSNQSANLNTSAVANLWLSVPIRSSVQIETHPAHPSAIRSTIAPEIGIGRLPRVRAEGMAKARGQMLLEIIHEVLVLSFDVLRRDVGKTLPYETIPPFVHGA